MLERADSEIEDQIGRAESNRNKYPGMTYSEGVTAALLWVTGNVDDLPMEDD